MFFRHQYFGYVSPSLEMKKSIAHSISALSSTYWFMNYMLSQRTKQFQMKTKRSWNRKKSCWKFGDERVTWRLDFNWSVFRILQLMIDNLYLQRLTKSRSLIIAELVGLLIKESICDGTERQQRAVFLIVTVVVCRGYRWCWCVSTDRVSRNTCGRCNRRLLVRHSVVNWRINYDRSRFIQVLLLLLLLNASIVYYLF